MVVRQGESVRLALKRLKKLAEKNGITRDLKRHEFFQDESEKRRTKRFRKRYRSRKATLLD